MKEFFLALFSLLFFRPYTIYPRWFEIALGISAWVGVSIIIWAIFKIKI